MDIFRKIKLSESEENTLQNILNEIDKLSIEWGKNKNRQQAGAEEIQQHIDTDISASLSLENYLCTPAQIEKIIARQEKSDDKKENLVKGYNTILNALYSNPQKYPLCEDTIIALHSALFPNGKTRLGKNSSNKPGAVNFLDYKAPTLFNRNQAVSVNNEIHDLVEWTNRELSRNSRHKLISIAVFAYEFISIHPFREGKGELSRILTTLLLLQNGYEWAKLGSIDSRIEARRSEYYKTLKNGQQNRYSSQENISAWVLFLCDVWLQSIRSLLPAALREPASPQPQQEEPTTNGHKPQKSIAANRYPAYLNPRQKQILKFIEKEGPVKVSDITSALKTVSINTIKKDMLYLRQQKLVEIHGILKGTLYTLARQTIQPPKDNRPF